MPIEPVASEATAQPESDEPAAIDRTLVDPTAGPGGWRASLPFALALLATVALDQATKRAVADWLPPGGRWPGADWALARYFTFTHVHNTGMAFGLGQGRSAWFAVLASVIVTGLVVYQARLPRDARWVRVALGLQAGGAIGNLVDRLRQGWVTDFFDFQFWPVFNVADSMIFIGVAILAWHLWQAGPPDDAPRGAGVGDAEPAPDPPPGAARIDPTIDASPVP